MFLLFICTVAFFNFILCNTIDRETNEIPSDHALQCDQNGEFSLTLRNINRVFRLINEFNCVNANLLSL